MKITIHIIHLLILTVLFNISAYASDDLKFEYHIQRFNQSSQIAFQVFKNAPYPFRPLNDQGYDVKNDFKRANTTVMIKDEEVKASYFLGWVFLDIDANNGSCVLPLVQTLEQFRQGLPTDISPLAELGNSLRIQCEGENLENPYAGRSLTADYRQLYGIPVEDSLIPTATPIVNADRFVKSLAFVYGGVLELNDARTVGFYHGNHRVFSYGNRTISSAYTGSQSLKAQFRFSDDGKTANKKLKIINFPSWF